MLHNLEYYKNLKTQKLLNKDRPNQILQMNKIEDQISEDEQTITEIKINL
jgi:hypothetical protein